MKIIIVIPLHNEKKHITDLLVDLQRIDSQIVVVDDGSTDASNSKVLEVMRSKKILPLRGKKIILLNHKINLGKGAAMKTGAEYAFSNGAEAVIFMDSDGQHLVSDIPKFVEALSSKKVDVVFGSRNLNLGVPLVRYLGNKVASVTASLLFGSYVSDAICGFRGLTKKGYKKIEWESTGYGVEMEMVARVGKYKVSYSEVPVETVYHDKVKGVTLLDAFGILWEVVKWKLTI